MTKPLKPVKTESAKTRGVVELRKALNQKFLERSDLIDGMLTSLLSSEPLLMIGPPGTAKSMICQAICDSLSGAKFFQWMMSKFTVSEELFGPLSLKALEQDSYIRTTKDKLPEADIAFLDEVFKGSSAILNTMLTILNEKTFHNGGVTKVPLKTLYAASNEIPQAEELSAFYDRFVIRFFVEPVRDNDSVRALFKGLAQVQMPSISLKELEDEQKAAAMVTVSDQMVDLLIRLRREIENEGFVVSDRKWVQATRVLKAFAHLNGHDEVEDSDFDILSHVLWSAPEQRAKIRKIVMRVANPIGEKIVDIIDGVRDIDTQLNSGNGDAVEAFKKVKHALKELDKLGDVDTNQRLAKAVEQVRAIQASIARNHLGLND